MGGGGIEQKEREKELVDGGQQSVDYVGDGVVVVGGIHGDGKKEIKYFSLSSLSTLRRNTKTGSEMNSPPK